MKLEIGKRYVMRDGSITAPLVYDNSETAYKYDDPISGYCWTKEGRYMRSVENHQNDLVSEYAEPSQANEFEQRLAACEAKQAEHDELLARIAALLGIDAPKAEPPSRYFGQREEVWLIAGDGVFYRDSTKTGWVKSVLSVEEFLDCHMPEITAEQAEAILKGGAL